MVEHDQAACAEHESLMGIRPAALRLIVDHFPAKRVLSLSYPDLVMSQDELEDITGFRTTAEVDAGAV